MADSVNMSLDDIIRQNKQQYSRASRTRGRGGGNIQSRGNNRGGGGGGRGGGRGRGRGRGRGGRGRSQSRPGTPGVRQGRSASRGRQGRSQSRSQSRSRSRSRQQRRSVSRARSASRSRSQLRLTPKGRAGLEDQISNMPALVRGGGFNRGGWQTRLRRSNSNPNLYNGIHNRLGINRGGVNNRRPLAVAKRGISKRGRGLSTNRYSAVGLRSDQILKEQRQHLIRQNNMIQSQTFTRSRSRNNSFNASQLTVSVANDFTKRRRNSVGNAGYLNQQSLAQLNNQYGGYNTRRGPGSVKSMGSNRSNRSNRSSRSNVSNASRRSNRSRGRGRGGNRGIGRKFVNKQILNPKLQKEIAAIQGKSFGSNNASAAEAPGGISFTPTPAVTAQSLHQRFAST